jgi:glycosyltransferase involved in cell wall biosynthesis
VTSLLVYNPLPASLAHYTCGVEQMLDRSGVGYSLVTSTAVEIHGGSSGRLVPRAMRAMVERGSLADLPVLALWPTFADLDPALWAVQSRGRVTLVWHDPIPLRPTRGAGRAPRAIGQFAQRVRGTRILTHSERARSDLEDLGWRVTRTVPHPFVARPVSGSADPDTVLVAGQHKPQRDLQLLAELGPRLAALGMRPRIVGSGWPPVPGWHVESRFLREDELDAEMADAAVVLLPYQRVYQSGIAVRAAEMGTPVVGHQDTNIAEMYGRDWPGLVTTNDHHAWMNAIGAAVDHDRGDVADRLAAWKTHVISDWATLCDDNGWSPARRGDSAESRRA